MERIFNAGMLAAALAVCTPGFAARPVVDQTIVAPTLTEWSNRVFHDLNQVFVYPVARLGAEPSTGIVAVKFNCSDSGAPAHVALYKSSGHRDLDRAVVRAVSHIATLHPLPSGMNHGQQIIVRALAATSAEDADRQIAKMRAEADHSNAWFGKRTPSTVALEIVPSGG